MKDSNYSKQITISANSKQVFQALNLGLNTWWGNISNAHFEEGGQFTITFENGYWWTFKILEHTPSTELIWKCIDGDPEFNKEWIGHILHWTLSQQDNKTQLKFQQTGLTPNLHCYTVCSKTWNTFLSENLKTFLETKHNTV